ncbi:MAG: hypothetical protein HOB49_11105, partial [Gemmatimonadetes bacterium]|nr:hypothetical protein [Gemmatimonadota bacterium]
MNSVFMAPPQRLREIVAEGLLQALQQLLGGKLRTTTQLFPLPFGQTRYDAADLFDRYFTHRAIPSASRLDIGIRGTAYDGDRARRFHLLRQLPPRDVAPFIVHEHPQTIALILSQLAPEQAAATLDQLAED